MVKKAIIFGTGSFAELAHFFLSNDSDYEVCAFCSTAEYLKTDRFCGLPLVPFETIENDYSTNEHDMLIAVGYNKLNTLREKIYYEAKRKGYQLLSYVSSRASVFAKHIGDNCFIFEDNTIQPFVSIGNNVVLWSGNHIGHHSVIEDHVFITSHVVISGHCVLKRNTFVGVNATLRDGITIESENIIGAGALVMKNTKEKEVYRAQPTQAYTRDSSKLKRI